MLVAANFGDFAQGNTGVGEAVVKAAAEEHGVTLMGEKDGLLVYAEPSLPEVFLKLSATGIVTVGEDNFKLAWERHREAGHLLPAARVAYILFSASRLTQEPQSSIVLLVAALESLAGREERSAAAVAHINAMILDTARRDDIVESERKSIVGGLRDLRKESITSAVKRLAAACSVLPGMTDPPLSVVSEAYKLRSVIVHGGDVRSSASDLLRLTPQLQRLVADLIARSRAS
jgi:hypothetical protein